MYPRTSAPTLAPLLWAALALLGVLALAGCDRTGASGDSVSDRGTVGSNAAPAGGEQTGGGTRPTGPGNPSPFAGGTGGPEDERPVILCLGDSLTAGHGLPESQAYPSLLQAKVDDAGYTYRVVNAGVSGDTSAGGLGRLDWLLRMRVAVLVLALGANDGLRGIDPDAMKANLAAIIERAQGRGIEVLLAGMKMPVNYGGDYRHRFEAVFPALAKAFGVKLLPFLLEDVAGRPSLNQADGIHPNAAGQRIIAEHVWQALQPMLQH